MGEFAAAAAAGLRYVDPREPGFGRRRCGRAFAYFDPDGGLVRDENLRTRFAKLAIPPAWRDVWICADPLGHIQATARDAKGRKQYRYHASFRAVRDEVKFERMPTFGAQLPTLRRRVERDLESDSADRRALAAVVRLLDVGALRIGSSDAYEGKGAATLEKTDVSVGRERLRLAFTGKSGVRHELELCEPKLAKVVRRLQSLPGQRLFKISRDEGGFAAVTSGDVNDYIESVMGERHTAKEFRTWAAGAAACAALLSTEEKPNLKIALAAAAERLGNTPTVCRKSYVHPAVINLALAGERPPIAPAVRGLTVSERAFLAAIAAPPACAQTP